MSFEEKVVETLAWTATKSFNIWADVRKIRCDVGR